MAYAWRLPAIRRNKVNILLASTSHPVIATAQHRVPIATATAQLSAIARQQHTAAATQTQPPHEVSAPATSSHSDPSSNSGLPRKSRWNPDIMALDRLNIAQPLPPDVQEAYRQSIRPPTERSRKSASSRSDTKKPGNPLAYGDFTGATLEAIRTDATNFPAPQSAEKLAILRACLGTNLLSRALRIFEELRNEVSTPFAEELASEREQAQPPSLAQRKQHAALSLLDLSVYNAVLAAICRRAAAEESPFQAQTWIDQAWVIYNEMEHGVRATDRSKSQPGISSPQTYTADPLPNISTIWTFSRGLIKIMQRHTSIGLEQSGLGDLVASGWRLGVDWEAVLSPFPPNDCQDDCAHDATADENDSQRVAQLFKSAAAYSGHEMSRVAIEEAEVRVQARMAESGDAHSSYGRIEPPNPAADIPELMPTKSSGSSLSEDPGDSRPLNLWLLQQDLDVVSKGRSSLRDNEARQRWLEESALESARKRLEADASSLDAAGATFQGVLAYDTTLQKWMFDWIKKLEDVLTKEVERIKEERVVKTESNDSSTITQEQLEQTIGPFLQLLSPSKMALITVLELMRMQGSDRSSHDVKTTRALIHVGMALEQEYYAEVLTRNPQIVSNNYHASQLVRSKGTTDMLQRRQAKKWLESQASSLPYEPWTQTIRARLGSFLVGHFLRVAKVKRRAVDRDGNVWDEEHPAIYATYTYMQGKKLGVIKTNDAVAERLDKSAIRSTLHPRFLPMLVKPRLWLGHESGGYLTHKNSLVRVKDSAEQSLYIQKASESQALETVGAGLDVLGETPWTINEDVFKVMTDVWNSGEATADMPPRLDDDFGAMERPENYDTDMRARSQYLRTTKQAQLTRNAIYGLRCETNYKLEIARAYLGERFYFPHNLDFRGRAYPIPPHLNHIGNDLSRGLLLFADGRPLGKPGLRWLKIHLANVFGYDKASFEERERFATNHLSDVEDAVNNPLNGKRWWLEADDPWQCLAACHELHKALNHPDGPENYPSRLPIHQDGTCNGLQHYAALGGDLGGAKQVNLASGDRPSDVYTAVADLVIADIEAEAAKPSPDPRALLLKGKITRKVVKQTVMTTVYGVTFIGAKAQVMRQLAHRGDVPVEQLWTTASFLASRVLKSVGSLFSGADMIKNWLVDSALLISKSIPLERLEFALSFEDVPGSGSELPKGMSMSRIRQTRLAREQMTSVVWTSPLGLPIVQPYRKNKKKQITTAMQTVFLSDPNQVAEVASGKQASAFPPNFVHSLDATHMILTALECRDAGLTFASVHDSYWTHACDVETMSEIIRDTFVRLHLQPILPTLRQEFLERFGHFKVPIEVVKAIEDRNKRRARKMRRGEVESVQKQSPEQAAEDGPTVDEAIEEDEAETLSVAESSPEDPSSPPEDASSSDVQPEKAKAGRKRKRSTEEYIKAKYVNVADVLPPLPEKGAFDVNEIRTSQYFFS